MSEDGIMPEGSLAGVMGEMPGESAPNILTLGH